MMIRTNMRRPARSPQSHAVPEMVGAARRGRVAERLAMCVPAIVLAAATMGSAVAATPPAALQTAAETPITGVTPGTAKALPLTDVSATTGDTGATALADSGGASGFPEAAGSVAAPEVKRWALYGQMTLTAMNAFGFANPYQGAQSLVPHDLRETWDATLYLGARPWKGGEIWINPEVDQGFGLANTLGMAGFPSAEAYKLGAATPYVRLQRLFLRQTFNLGGALSQVDAAANQMAGTQAENRIVVTIGKFCVVDIFDTNKYAHDPRGDFLNWSIVDAGGFDYAGDPWGYTYGAAAEVYVQAWTARVGLVNLSTVPGGPRPTTNYSEFQLATEIEHRHTIDGHAGAIRLGLWLNHARMGGYADAIAWGIANGTAPGTNQVLAMHNRLGGYINAEQAFTDTLGGFLRASVADGRYGAYDFTDIDRSFSGGLSLAGKGWHRADDTVGIAVVANQISKEAQAYFAAGGMGILIGDGQLPRPGTEKILEAYYAWRPMTPVAVTFDYQFAVNPAYNKDRGPANIVGLRLHVAF